MKNKNIALATETNAGAAGLTYIVEVSSDLTTWLQVVSTLPLWKRVTDFCTLVT